MNNIPSLKSENSSINQLKLESFYFGPIICHSKLSKTFIDELRLRGNKSNMPYNHALAGHIDNENAYNEDDKIWFMNSTADIFKAYVANLSRYSLNEIGNKPPVKGITLFSLWINYMKQHEFNPLHAHSGDVSFVIYLQVPDEIKNEFKSFKGNGIGPGSIGFYYGERADNIKTEYQFFPGEGDMFMFPAHLKHMVPPFKSNVTRISVSGNLNFDY